jgi:elongation factor Tu
MFRKILDRGEAGDNAGIFLLRGIEKDDIKRGMVICASQVQLNHT